MIVAWSLLDEATRARALPEVREIFFSSSVRQDFSSLAEREKFWHKWTDHYFAAHQDLILVALAGERVVGYVTACDQSFIHGPMLARDNPAYRLFEDQFRDFPAHLHINLAAASRGRGLGGKLIQALTTALVARDCHGLHLVTAPDARNVNFYRRLGFNHEVERPWLGHRLLLMGRRLTLLANRA